MVIEQSITAAGETDIVTSHNQGIITIYIFMKRGMCEDIKNGIHMRQNRKYKNTNTERHKYTHTQIQHMTKCQKDPT